MKTIMAIICVAFFLSEIPINNRALDAIRNYIENNGSRPIFDSTLPKLAVEVGPAALPEMEAWFFDSDEKRGTIARVMAIAGGEEAVDFLMNAFETGNETVLPYLWLAIASSGDLYHASQLFDILNEDDVSGSGSRYNAYTLGILQADFALPSLEKKVASVEWPLIAPAEECAIRWIIQKDRKVETRDIEENAGILSAIFYNDVIQSPFNKVCDSVNSGYWIRKEWGWDFQKDEYFKSCNPSISFDIYLSSDQYRAFGFVTISYSVGIESYHYILRKRNGVWKVAGLYKAI